MDLEYLSIRKVLDLLEIGSKIVNTDTDSSSIRMGHITRVNLKAMQKQDTVPLHSSLSFSFHSHSFDPTNN
jgi:hypothetical protein